MMSFTLMYEFEREIQQLPNTFTKIYIFDFDGTLYSSPLPNSKLWTSSLRGLLMDGLGWFLELETLSEDNTSQEWFAEDIAQQVIECKRDPQNLVVLMTGRRLPFLDRIVKLCHEHQPALNFDLYQQQ
jgi:trehalose-6-phosphatase